MTRSCDRCGGNHPTDGCEIYLDARIDHKDAQILPTDQRPAPRANAERRVARGKLVPQPNDGNCMYHSLQHGLVALGLGERGGQRALRRQLAHWALEHGETEVGGNTVNQWLQYEFPERTITTAVYAASMGLRTTSTRWGGSIELAGCAHLKTVGVSVWLPLAGSSTSFVLSSSFDVVGARGR